MTIRKFQGLQPRISNTAYVDKTALVIGDVSLGADSSIWPMTTVRGDINSITIGERTNIQDGSILHVTHDGKFTPGGVKMSIGNDVTVGHGVVLHACTLEDLCLIGIGSIVLDGAVVRSQVILGAGSLVTIGKQLDSGLWMGRPAKRVRDLTPSEIEYLKYSAAHYVKVKNLHIESPEA